MFWTVNEHLDKEEGIQCLKANCAFKQLSILSSRFVHTFSPLRHFALHLWFHVFKVLPSQEGLCFAALHSWAPSGTSHEGISGFLTLYPLNFFQSLLHTEINVWWATPQHVKEQWKQRILTPNNYKFREKCHQPPLSPNISLCTSCGSMAA